MEARKRGLTWRAGSVGARCRLLAGFGLAVGAVLMFAGSATATVPGTNGPISFVRYVQCSTNTNLWGDQLYKVNPDGSGFTNLSQSVCSGYSDQNPKWSPDGSKVAFVRCCQDGVDQVYVMNADGSHQTQLGNGLFDDFGPIAWSPTGSRIAFIRSGSIWTMNSDGSSPVQVPNTSDVGSSYGMSWSPDGTRIAFNAYEPNYGEQDIYTVAPTGASRSDLTYGSGYDSYGASDWSPSGAQILTTRFSCSASDAWTVNANGSGATDVTCGDTTTSDHFYPAWSPDGTKIVFGDGTVYTMNSNGSGESAIVSGFNPSWGVPVSPPPPLLPGAVSNLSGGYNSSTQVVSLLWTNPSATSTTGATTGDVVRRGNVNGACPSSSTTGASIGGTGLRTSESDSVSGLTQGLYCYSVFATNAVGAGPVNTVSVNTGKIPNPPGVPQYHFYQPSGLTTGSSPTVSEQTTWTPSSTSGVTYTLQEQVNGGSWTTVLSGTTALQFKTQLVSNTSYAFRVEAVAGSNMSAFAANTPFAVLPFQDSALSYSGTWSLGSVSTLWGGSDHFTKAAGASASLSFTGRNVAVIGSMGTGNGSAKEYIDGALVKTISENAGSTKYRQVVAKWGWSTPGPHTIKMVNVATSGHPRFDIDGIVVFQ